MNKKLLRNALSLAVLVVSMNTLEAAQEEKKTARPFVPVIQKDGKKAQRRCFKDADKNGFCDNGSEQKWKCKNNCRLDVPAAETNKPAAAPAEQKKQTIQKEEGTGKTLSSLCTGCPMAGNCTHGCLALPKK